MRSRNWNRKILKGEGTAERELRRAPKWRLYDVFRRVYQSCGQAFEKRLPLLGETGVSVKKWISDCPDGVRELLQFYYGFMPLSDAFGYEPDLFYQYAAHAAFLRKTSACCAALPEEVFLHDVAWYRINSERIVDCRRFFYEKTASLIEGLEEERAVLELNLLVRFPGIL